VDQGLGGKVPACDDGLPEVGGSCRAASAAGQEPCLTFVSDGLRFFCSIKPMFVLN
jgi:hypothetical protein